jgi:radical SAM protein with 4Fe4S-binding SPASM domain
VATRRRHKYFLFELTKGCQNSCLFCYNVWKERGDYPQGELTIDQAKALLNKVIDETGCEHIALTGGEPLLKEGVLEISYFIAQKGVMPILISNGRLLTPEMVRKCMDSGMEYFEVSLHSHKAEIHDQLAGRRGSFEKAVDAILNVTKAGGHVNTVFVATSKNVNDFERFVELNALLRTDWILFNRVACGGASMKRWPELAPSPMELQKVLQAGSKLASRYKIGMSVGVQVQPCLVDLSGCQDVGRNFCPLNDPTSDASYFVIDPAGNLRMCNRAGTILGNLLESSVGDLTEHPEVERFARAIPNFCRDCEYAEVCAGGCKADALSYYGTLDKPDPYLELWKAHARKPGVRSS